LKSLSVRVDWCQGPPIGSGDHSLLRAIESRRSAGPAGLQLETLEMRNLKYTGQLSQLLPYLGAICPPMQLILHPVGEAATCHDDLVLDALIWIDRVFPSLRKFRMMMQEMRRYGQGRRKECASTICQVWIPLICSGTEDKPPFMPNVELLETPLPPPDCRDVFLRAINTRQSSLTASSFKTLILESPVPNDDNHASQAFISRLRFLVPEVRVRRSWHDKAFPVPVFDDITDSDTDESDSDSECWEE